MEKGYCLVTFTEDPKVTKVANFEIVRYKDGSRFVPTCAADKPKERVKVKWQRSMAKGSFSHDGYYYADVLAIASTYETIQEKAVDLGFKTPVSMLSLPPTSTPIPQNRSAKLKARERAEALTVVKSSKDHDGTRKQNVEKVKERNKQDKCSSGFTSHKANKFKPNKLAKNEVCLERLDAVYKEALQKNPLLKHQENVSDESESEIQNPKIDKKQTLFEHEVAAKMVIAKGDKGSPKRKREERPASFSVSSLNKDTKLELDGEKPAAKKKKKESSSSQRSEGWKKLNDEIVTGNESPALSTSSSLTDDLHNKPAAKGRSRSCSPLHPMKNFKQDKKEQKDENEFNERELEDTLPASHLSISSEHSSDTPADKTSDDENDEVYEIMEDNAKLIRQIKSQKQKIADMERQFIVANNLRLQYKQRNEEVEEILMEKTEEIKVLSKRNATLQDLLSDKFSDTSKSSTQLHRRKDVDQVSPKKSSETKKSIDRSHQSGKLLKDQVDMCSYVDDLDSSDVLLNEEGWEPAASTPKKAAGFSDVFQASTPKNSSKDTDSNSIVQSNKKSSSGKKKKDSKDDQLVNNDDMKIVCEKVLKHWQGVETLTSDRDGYVDVGLDVKLPLKKLNENIKNNKLDISKFTKTLTAMTWTLPEREERSLEGGINNRFPNAPSKKVATPNKVFAVLVKLKTRTVKAHLLHCGDKEGPGMNEALKNCRRSIGSKFAQEGLAAKVGILEKLLRKCV